MPGGESAALAPEPIGKACAPRACPSPMPYPLNTWWFWVFVAPEAVLFVGWLVFVVFAGIGFGATAARERLTRGRRGDS